MIDKIYAGWLGKILGVLHGAPIEFWRKEKIQEFYGEITEFMNKSEGFFAPDDDINGTIFFQKAVEHYYDNARDILPPPSKT